LGLSGINGIQTDDAFQLPAHYVPAGPAGIPAAQAEVPAKGVVTFTGDVKLVLNSIDPLQNPGDVTLTRVIIDLSDTGSIVLESHAASLELSAEIGANNGLQFAGVITTDNDAATSTGAVGGTPTTGNLLTYDVTLPPTVAVGHIASPATINKKDIFDGSGTITVEPKN
jgi:hypothetical protein